jgi:hypothetical protein
MDEKFAYTIPEFCKLHNISRTVLYSEWEKGRGPARMLVGQERVRISREAAEAWRRDRELAALEAPPPRPRGRQAKRESAA